MNLSPAQAAALRAIALPGAASVLSEAHGDRLVQLAEANAEQLRSSALHLEQSAGDLVGIGTELRVAASHCASGGCVTALATSVLASADDAAHLAGVLRTSAAEWDDLLTQLVQTMLRAVRSVVNREVRVADREAATLDELWDAVTGADRASALERTVTSEYSAAVWSVWQPLAPNRAAPGPSLAGTDGERPETDTGVRIAQLPDKPSARR